MLKSDFKSFFKISTLRLREHQERRAGKILKDRRRACLIPDFFFPLTMRGKLHLLNLSNMVVSTRPEQDEPSWHVNIDMGNLTGPHT